MMTFIYKLRVKFHVCCIHIIILFISSYFGDIINHSGMVMRIWLSMVTYYSVIPSTFLWVRISVHHLSSRAIALTLLLAADTQLQSRLTCKPLGQGGSLL